MVGLGAEWIRPREASGQRSACADREVVLRRQRPAPGAGCAEWIRPQGAFGPRSACADRKEVLRRRRPAPGAERLWRPISIGVKASGQRSACADREVVLCVGGGRRLAWRVPNEFGLKGPSADGRPVPTGRLSFVSAEADARRGAPLKADFNRRESLRPTVGLCRPGGCPLRRRRPAPGAGCAEWIRPQGASGRRSACADREVVLCVGGGRRPARSASEGRFQSV